MTEKFNFYDFVGYVIPGAFFISIVYWISYVVLNTPFNISAGLFSTILFLMLSYFFGHILQVLGGKIEKRLFNKWGGYFSVTFLKEENDHFSKVFRKKLIESIKSEFALPDYREEGIENKIQEYFNLCYSLVVDKGIAIRSEIFIASAALCRGLLALFYSSIVFMSLLIIYLVIDYISFAALDKTKLTTSIIIFAFSAICIIPITRRFKDFSGRFVNSVFRSFYVWSKTKNSKE